MNRSSNRLGNPFAKRAWIVRALLVAAMLILAAGCRMKTAGDNISRSLVSSGQSSGLGSYPTPTFEGRPDRVGLL
jgi:hypothetical protein